MAKRVESSSTPSEGVEVHAELEKLALNAGARVSLKVYDVTGREVLTALDGVSFEPGRHPIRVDLSDRTPGLYFCRLTANGYSATRKLLLIH